ncbi:hypothetical protein OHB24_24215 [Kribbella sp. NBC_00482]|uniref:hypothetical protein n=1 Tax=Kribbella sp. NBC_00482 TaxID=2975968 RepID=UPI002E18560D
MIDDRLFKSWTLVLRNSKEDAQGIVEDLGWSRSDADDDYWESADDVTLFLRHDRTSGELGCNLRGVDRDAVSRHFDDLEARMDAFSTEELLAGIDQAETAAETAQALFRLGLGAPLEFDERTATQVVGALSFEHPMIRAAAVRTIGYLIWGSMLRPPVERVFDDDPDERVQRQAGQLLSAFDQVAAGRTS